MWTFAVMLGERRVSVMDVCRYLVDLYGTVIHTSLDILYAIKVLTFWVA